MTLSMHVSHRNTLSYRCDSAANAVFAVSFVSNAPNTADPLPVISRSRRAEIPQIRNRIRNCWTHLLAYRLQYVPQRRGQCAQIPIRQSRLRRVIVRAERNRLCVVRRKHIARRKSAARLNHHQWEALPAGEFLYCFPNAAGAGQSAADTERHVRSQRQADIFQLRPRQPGFP